MDSPPERPQVGTVKELHPFGVLPFALFIIGLAVAILASGLLGGVIIIVAFILDRPRHVCSACGNRVEPSSLLCPTCHTQLAHGKESRSLNVIMALCLIGLVIIGLILLAN